MGDQLQSMLGEHLDKAFCADLANNSQLSHWTRGEEVCLSKLDKPSACFSAKAQISSLLLFHRASFVTCVLILDCFRCRRGLCSVEMSMQREASILWAA